MPAYVVAAALAVTLSIPILWYSLAVDRAPARRVARNLTAGIGTGGDLRGIVLSQSPAERILRPVFLRLAGPARRLSPAGMVAALERRVELAGVAWPIERVLVAKLALGGTVLMGGLVWASQSRSGTVVFVTLLLSAGGYVAPDAVLARLSRERQFRMSNALADTLDQLTICVEAGLGFDAALARSAKTGDGPLAKELTLLLQELRLGVPRAEALQNLLGRTEVPELRQFVHAVTQAETYGVPISRALRTQAVEQREKRRFRAEERAMKLPVKVIFPLVLCILPAMFIVILGPAFVHITKGLG